MQVAEPAGPRDEVAGLRTKIEDYERWFRTLDGQICTLEREQQKLDSLVKHADFGMALLDSGSRVVWSNAVFRKQLQPTGPKPQDPLGLSCNQAICRKTLRTLIQPIPMPSLISMPMPLSIMLVGSVSSSSTRRTNDRS